MAEVNVPDVLVKVTLLKYGLEVVPVLKASTLKDFPSEERSASGYLYVRCHYESISSEDNALSGGSIFGIVIGSIAFIVICIIILYYFFFRFRKNKNDFGPTTQSNYSAYSSNQPNTALPVNNPTILLQTVPMRNEAN